MQRVSSSPSSLICSETLPVLPGSRLQRKEFGPFLAAGLRQQCPGSRMWLVPGSSSCSEVLPCPLAAQVTKRQESLLRGTSQWHFCSIKLFYPADAHAVLVAVMSKHVPSSNPREQRHPSEALRRDSCPVMSFVFSAVPKVGWEVLASR